MYLPHNMSQSDNVIVLQSATTTLPLHATMKLIHSRMGSTFFDNVHTNNNNNNNCLKNKTVALKIAASERQHNRGPEHIIYHMWSKWKTVTTAKLDVELIFCISPLQKTLISLGTYILNISTCLLYTSPSPRD